MIKYDKLYKLVNKTSIKNLIYNIEGVFMKIRKAVIPAAGLGTRFLPVTKALPKEMLPIVDKPAIQYIIEEAVNSGIDDIIIITGKGKRAIEDHFDRSFELNERLKQKGKLNLLKELERIESLADIHYIRQKEPLGLGHAILKARKHMNGEPFVVMLGDDIVKSKVPCTKNLINQAIKLNSSVIAVQQIPKELLNKYGVIKAKKVNNDNALFLVEDLVEKPKIGEAPSDLAVLGRYVLMPEIFDYLEKTKPGKNNEIQLTDALRAMNKDKQIFAHKINGEWLTVGDPLNYLKTVLEFSLERPDLLAEFKKFLKDKGF